MSAALDALGDADAKAVLGRVEAAARDVGARLGQAVLQASLDAADTTPGGPVLCGQGHPARLVERRAKEIRTMTGPVQITRPYYHCDQCGQGLAPFDQRLGVEHTTMSPHLVKAASLAGMKMPFAKAEEFLDDILGSRLASAKTIDRATKTTGRAARRAIDAETAALNAGTLLPLRPAPSADMCYLVIDGTGAPMLPRETQGRQGKHPDQRARTREVKLACLFTTSVKDPATGGPVQDPGSASYIATFEPAAAFADQLRAEVRRRGFKHIRQGVVIGDGAHWIWNIANDHYPAHTQIVDYYHAAEHVHDLAKLLENHLDEPRADWTKARLDELWQGHTHAIARAVDILHLDQADPDLAVKAATATGYFTGNHHRMQYARFEALGMFIGSGFVESACNTIVAQRAKQAGMHWTINGLDPILALRALRQSNRDHLIWQQDATQTPQHNAA